MFKKGQSGNPSGRPKGAKNVATSSLIERLTAIIDNNIDRVQNDLDLLPPGEREKALTSLMCYVLPKKQAVDVKQSLDYEYQKLKELLEQAPQECIDVLFERVVALHEGNTASMPDGINPIMKED